MNFQISTVSNKYSVKIVKQSTRNIVNSNRKKTENKNYKSIVIKIKDSD